MKIWEAFEKRIVHDFTMQGHFIARIPTGARVVKGGAGLTFKGQKTPFDFASCVEGVAVFFDAKCVTSGSRFNFKSLVLAPKKVHQYEALCAARKSGAEAGYMIWWYNTRQITWLDIAELEYRIRSGSPSISPESLPGRTFEDHLKIDPVKWILSI